MTVTSRIQEIQKPEDDLQTDLLSDNNVTVNVLLKNGEENKGLGVSQIEERILLEVPKNSRKCDSEEGDHPLLRKTTLKRKFSPSKSTEDDAFKNKKMRLEIVEGENIVRQVEKLSLSDKLSLFGGGKRKMTGQGKSPHCETSATSLNQESHKNYKEKESLERIDNLENRVSGSLPQNMFVLEATRVKEGKL